jgi:hypothetical protein
MYVPVGYSNYARHVKARGRTFVVNPKRPGFFGQLDTRGGGGVDSALFEKT